jgi:uncharacterized membrane protein YgaE (UPF0421/DUF939 family)
MVRFRREEAGETLGTWLAIFTFFAVYFGLAVKFGLLITFLLGWLPAAVIAVGVAHAVKAAWVAIFARPHSFVARTH